MGDTMTTGTMIHRGDAIGGRWLAIGAAVLAMALLPSGLLAARYRVSKSADGGGAGGAESKTVAGGLVKLRAAGDEVAIERGQYNESLEAHDLKGAADTPIIIRGTREAIPAAEAAQADAWLAHSTIIKPDKGPAMVLKNCTYVRIENLVFQGSKENGLVLDNCDHVTLYHCDAIDNGRCEILVKSGRNVTLDGCELSGSWREHGCQFLASDRPTVRNCEIHNNGGAGIYMTGDKTIAGNGLVDQPLIENNEFYANGQPKADAPRITVKDAKGKEVDELTPLREGPAAICGDSVEQAIIRNNLIHRNPGGGIVLYRQFGARAGQHNCVLHNTIYLIDCGGAYGLYLSTSTQDTGVHNNVIVTDSGPAMWLGPNASRDLHSDYNVFFRKDGKDPVKREQEELPLTRWQNLYSIDRNSILLNPPFVDPDNKDQTKCDYRLKAESTLENRCPFNGEVPNDLLGQWRPKSKVTAGCYEMNPTAESPTPPGQPRHSRDHSRGSSGGDTPAAPDPSKPAGTPKPVLPPL